MDGVSVGAVTSYTFTNVTANHTIAASFAINHVHDHGVGGRERRASAPSGAVGVSYGANQSVHDHPDAGYHVADVLVDGSTRSAR